MPMSRKKHMKRLMSHFNQYTSKLLVWLTDLIPKRKNLMYEDGR